MPLSFKDQIQKLESHGMIILDKESAEQELERINYYRFTGYALSFRLDGSGEKYKPGTNFNTVLGIYRFEEEFKALIYPYLSRIEIFARTQIAYWFSMKKSLSPPHMAHYDSKNFHDKFAASEVRKSLEKEENRNSDLLFVQYHKKKYGDKMPLWAMVELLSFSNLVKLYNAMWPEEKDAIATGMGTTRNVLKNHLLCLSKLRNKCAHYSRLYGKDISYNPPARLLPRILANNPEIKPNSLFAYIYVLARRLPAKTDKHAFWELLSKLIEKYRSKIDLQEIGFPSDYYKFY